MDSTNVVSLDQNIPDEAELRFDFDKSKVYLKKIISQWDTELLVTKSNRLKRDVDIDSEDLRKRGDIAPDETFIPDRTIELNIRREQPSYASYLVQSRRLGIFRCKSQPGLDSQRLEIEFTNGLRYPGWISPWFKEVDGTQAHGWDSIEVIFDEDKPLHVALEHIGHDKLFWVEGTEKLQDAP